MCLLEKPLAKSHLIPAGVYKYHRKGEHRPIRIGRGIVLPTDEQTQDYLLCNDCENILSRGGETWVVGKLLTLEKKFPLYDLLTQQKSDIDADEILVYFAARNPKIKTDRLTHFALGIFWKASVHSWGAKGEIDQLINLGPYSDRIRLWLRGEGEFPERLYLNVFVSRPQKAQPSACEPVALAGQGWRRFDFHVPGLSFVLNTGSMVDPAIRALSLHAPGTRSTSPTRSRPSPSNCSSNIFSATGSRRLFGKRWRKSLGKVAGRNRSSARHPLTGLWPEPSRSGRRSRESCGAAGCLVRPIHAVIMPQIIPTPSAQVQVLKLVG